MWILYVSYIQSHCVTIFSEIVETYFNTLFMCLPPASSFNQTTSITLKHNSRACCYPFKFHHSSSLFEINTSRTSSQPLPRRPRRSRRPSRRRRRSGPRGRPRGHSPRLSLQLRSAPRSPPRSRRWGGCKLEGKLKTGGTFWKLWEKVRNFWKIYCRIFLVACHLDDVLLFWPWDMWFALLLIPFVLSAFCFWQWVSTGMTTMNSMLYIWRELPQSALNSQHSRNQRETKTLQFMIQCLHFCAVDAAGSLRQRRAHCFRDAEQCQNVQICKNVETSAKEKWGTESDENNL